MNYISRPTVEFEGDAGTRCLRAEVPPRFRGLINESWVRDVN